MIPLVISVWLLIQILLPLRHWFIKGDVLWTEEGHRMSWRMMLRSKNGYNVFTVKQKGLSNTEKINLYDYLTKKQVRTLVGKPDVIWQFAQYLKKEYAKKGKEIEVYVDSWAGVNGSKKQQLIDPNVNLAEAKWRWWKHNKWILDRKDLIRTPH